MSKPARAITPAAECQICERAQKTRNGVMVLHGYKRPGRGYLIGDCMGVAHVPYSQGTDALLKYRIRIAAMVANLEAYVARLASPTLTYFTETTLEYARDPVTGHISYEGRHARMVPKLNEYAIGVTEVYSTARVLERVRSAAARELEQVQGELARVDRRIAAWTAPV